MNFMHGYVYDGRPYTSDVNLQWTAGGLPIWFSRGSLHRGQWVLEGPYTDPNGVFTVPAGHALVRWEVPQPAPGGIQDPRPEIFAILGIDREMINPDALIFRSVDPDFRFQSGDWCAVWFGWAHPAMVVGGYRDPNLNELRDHSGSIHGLDVAPAWVPSPGYVPGPPKGPPIPPDMGTNIRPAP